MDESVTIDDDAMNKYFTSKISVIASQETFNPVLARYITDLAKSDTTNLVYDDGTIDHNTRYIGSAPSNYLCFDAYCSNGKWRVIGVMNNIETEKSGTQSLVKIIRADSIGIYSWDTNSVNDWTTSTLQVNLNSGDLYAKYIKDYDDLLETVTWNLGGTNTNALDASSFYNVERGTATYGTRPTTWSGKIGLMYPSDYGLATSGGDTTDRATCLATNLVSWNSTDPDVSDCKNNDYLYLKTTEWALTPSSGESNRVFIVYSTGYVNYYSYYGISSYLYAVRPVGYLKASTEILSGNGTSSSPWIIGE
jgi:hypothetical protein